MSDARPRSRDDDRGRRGRESRNPRDPRDSDESRDAAGGAGIDDYASRVLDVVDSIAPGMVMSYGDVAEFIGAGGPRQVGRIMALWGGGVAWWRVVHADGSLLAGHERAALAAYKSEETPLRYPAAADRPGLT